MTQKLDIYQYWTRDTYIRLQDMGYWGPHQGTDYRWDRLDRTDRVYIRQVVDRMASYSPKG